MTKSRVIHLGAMNVLCVIYLVLVHPVFNTRCSLIVLHFEHNDLRFWPLTHHTSNGVKSLINMFTVPKCLSINTSLNIRHTNPLYEKVLCEADGECGHLQTLNKGNCPKASSCSTAVWLAQRHQCGICIGESYSFIHYPSFCQLVCSCLSRTPCFF